MHSFLVMLSRGSIRDSGKSAKIDSLWAYRQLIWPLFFAQAGYAIAFSGLLLNSLNFSLILWPDQPFHGFEMGLVVGVQNLGIAFLGVVIGRWGDRFPRKPLMVISIFVAALGRALSSFTPIGVKLTYPYFLGMVFLAGIGRGGFSPLVLSFTNDALPVQVRSRFFGFLESITQVCNIFGMIIGSVLISNGLWRVSFWVSSGGLVLSGIIIAVYVKEPKRGMNSHQSLTKLLTQSNVEYRYQLNWNTVKSTILSPTNILAFIEGIFTFFILSDSLFLIYPYIQSKPYNVSTVSSSILMSLFGVPGAIFGGIAFSRLSDRLGTKNIIRRVDLILFSIILLLFSILTLFYLPLPELTTYQGDHLRELFRYPAIWVLALVIFVMRAVMGIYNINQNPILQRINLPEAQATVSSLGQFLETISQGLGPILAGLMIQLNGENYRQAAIVIVLLGTPGLVFWVVARFYIQRDVDRVQKILTDRARAMEIIQEK